MSASDQRLDPNETFDILSSARRRYVISILHRRGEPIELTELAEEIAALEGDVTVDDLGKQQRKRVYVSLYQTHVPKLADAGIVTYDSDAGTVALARGSREVDAYLTQRSGTGRWGTYYLSFSVFVGGLLALVIADVGVFAQIPAAVVAAITVVGFGSLALRQHLSERSGTLEPVEFGD